MNYEEQRKNTIWFQRPYRKDEYVDEEDGKYTDSFYPLFYPDIENDEDLVELVNPTEIIITTFYTNIDVGYPNLKPYTLHYYNRDCKPLNLTRYDVVKAIKEAYTIINKGGYHCFGHRVEDVIFHGIQPTGTYDWQVPCSS